MKLNLKKQNDRYGYVDETGNWVIEPDFLCAEEFVDGLAIVRPRGLYGYLKEDGSWLVKPTLHYATPFEGEIARVKKGLFWGLINRRGEWVAEPTLIKAGEFKCGLCEVQTADKCYGYIDTTGKWIIPPTKGLELENLGGVQEGLIRIKKDGKYGFYDLEGNLAISPTFEEAYNFHEGLASAKDSETGLYGYIDKRGVWIIEPRFVKAGNFENERAAVSVTVEEEMYTETRATIIDRSGKVLAEPIFSEIKTGVYDSYNDPRIFGVTKDGRYGVIDRNGKVILKPEYERVLNKFEYATPDEVFLWILVKNDKYGLASLEKILIDPKYSNIKLSNGDLHLVEMKNKWGFVNRSGVEVLKPIYDSLDFFEDSVAKVELNDEKGWVDRDFKLLGGRLYEDTRDFGANGFAPVKVDGLWGLLNKGGEMVAEPQFDELLDFAGGLAAARVFVTNRRAARWGYINHEGQWVIKPAFEKAMSFANRSADIKSDGKWGRIDADGKWVIEPSFEYVERMSNDLSRARYEGCWGVIDNTGHWLLQPEYDKIKLGEDGLIGIWRDGKMGLSKMDGTILVQPDKYDDIPNFEKNHSKFNVSIKNSFDTIERKGKKRLGPVIKLGPFPFLANHGYWMVKMKHKWGIINKNTGKCVIEPIYEDFHWVKSQSLLIGESSPVQAIVWLLKNGKWGLIDLDGNWVLPPVFDRGFDIEFNFYNGKVMAESDGRTGLYDVVSNKWALEPRYDRIKIYDDFYEVELDDKITWIGYDGNLLTGEWYDEVDAFQDGIAMVKSGGKYGFIRKDGTWVVKPIYDRIKIYDDFYEVELDDKITWIGYDGNLLTGEWYDEVESFQDGIAMVKSGGKYGFIRKDGTWVVNPIYDGIQNFVGTPRNIRVFWIVDGKDEEGREKRKYCVVDLKGNFLTGRMFDDVSVFKNDMAQVRSGCLRGFIDADGNLVVEPKFKDVGYFMHNCALASLDGETYGYIDRNGYWKIEPQFECACAFERYKDGFRIPSGYAAAKKNGKWGIIDIDGNVVCDFIYDHLTCAWEGIRVAKLDGKYGYITIKGVVLAEPIYDTAAGFGWNCGAYSQPLGKVTCKDASGEINTLYITLNGEVKKNYKKR